MSLDSSFQLWWKHRLHYRFGAIFYMKLLKEKECELRGSSKEMATDKLGATSWVNAFGAISKLKQMEEKVMDK